jgi:hypothetical protein
MREGLLILQENSELCMLLGGLQMINMVSTNVVRFVGSQVVKWNQGHVTRIHPLR